MSGSSQRDTRADRQSIARPSTISSASRRDFGLRVLVVSGEQDVLVERLVRPAKARGTTVWKPATTRASGAPRAASSASESSPTAASAARPGRRPARDADDDLPREMRRERARGRLDADGRHGQEHDIPAHTPRRSETNSSRGVREPSTTSSPIRRSRVASPCPK